MLRITILLIYFCLFTQPGLSQEFSLMSYNIRYDTDSDGINRWDERKEWVADIINEHEPGIFGVQEALLHQLAYLDNNLERYIYKGVGRDDGKNKGEFTAIFIDTTQFNVLYNETFWLSTTPDTVSVGWDASMERISTLVKVVHKSTQKTAWVFNAHLDHIGEESRLNALRLIQEKANSITSSKEAVVLLGDFNATPDSAPITFISQNFDDAYHVAEKKGNGPVGTFHGFDPEHPLDFRIDYIFTKNLRTTYYQNIHLQDKDHFPSDHTAVFTRHTFN